MKVWARALLKMYGLKAVWSRIALSKAASDGMFIEEAS